MTRSIIGIGIFVTIVVAFTIGYIVMTSEKIFRDTYSVYAYFKNANGVLKNTDVRIAGVRVGRVKSVMLNKDRNRAKVTLEIYKNVQIYSDDVLKKTTSGVLGSSFLEIVTNGTGNALEKESEIINVEDEGLIEKLGKGTGSVIVNIESISKQLDTYLENGVLDQISRITTQLEATLKNIKAITENVSVLVQVNTEAINQTIRSLANITGEIQSFLVTDKKTNTQELSDTLISIKNSLANIETLTENLKDGKGTIGRLLSDETLYDNVNKAAANLTSITNRAAGLSTVFDYRFEGLFSKTAQFASKNHINLRIEPPQSSRYYQIGVTVGGPESINGVPTRSALGDSAIRLNLMLAQNFGKWLTVRGGLIESAGGLGIDIRPVKQWEISAEAFDFGGPAGAYLRTYTNIYPFLDPSDRYNPLRWIFFGGGVDDALNKYKRTYFFSVGLRLKDEFIYDTVRLLPLASSISAIK